jgi:3-phosphoshikimate 1-carboxyvinyltransferase
MSETPRSYPDKLEIKLLERPPVATVRVPGSKSITNRALVLAALLDDAEGCNLHGALRSEDTEVMVDSLRRLGFEVRTDWDRDYVDVYRPEPGAKGYEDPIPVNEAELFVANSGTSMRFLAAMVSSGRGRFRLDGVSRMRERPIEDLLSALRQLGVNARSEGGNGCPPVLIESDGLKGGEVKLRGDVSSQFLSGLLMAAPKAHVDTVISIDGPLVSEPYVAMTTTMLGQFGFEVNRVAPDTFVVPGHQRPCGNEPTIYHIEPDASAASYFFAASAITYGRVSVLGIVEKGLQGDTGFVDLLANIGCSVVRFLDRTVVYRSSPLRGIDVDMNAISDTVMTLAAVACFADGPTTIRNVAHIRHKETDRLAALATELRRVGAEVEEFADGLTITPRPLHGAEIETYNDHRMAMSMALIGLRVPGIVIKNPGCVAKTYPGFWEDLEKLRQ